MDSKNKEQILNKIGNSSLTSETKEIFSVLLDFFESIIKDKDEVIANYENKITSLQENVDRLEGKLDEFDQYNRGDTVVLSGEIPVETTNEDCKAKVLDLFESELSLKLDPIDLSLVHRIGKTTSGVVKRRIMAKFSRRDTVDEVFKACRLKKPKFFANCCLTPTRNKIFFAARKLKAAHPNVISSCRAVRGEVVVFLAEAESNSRRRIGTRQPARDPPRNRRVVLNTKKQLEEFAGNVLGTNLDSLNIDW